MEKSAVVIGAGVGGLCAALALHRAGVPVRVLEQAARLEPAGAGIAVAPNAVKALDSLGMAQWIDGAAVIQGSGGVRRPSGRWLVRTDLGGVRERFGRPLLVVPRTDLIGELAARLPAGALRLGAEVSGIEAGDEDTPARVTSAGEQTEAALVVAADGLRSTVRRALFPWHPGPSYAHFTAWRMITSVPGGIEITPSETWGRGAIFGLVPLSQGRFYCYATANLPAGTVFEDEKRALLSRFADWHDPIPTLIRRTPAESLIRNDVWELATPLERFHHGRVALLGDAAHAMTPNLGQGGCQAVEDAVVLAHHVASRDGDELAALARYTEDRLPRSTRIVARSRQTARMQQTDSRARIAVRDALIRLAGLAGSRLMLRQMRQLASWNPPSGGLGAPTDTAE